MAKRYDTVKGRGVIAVASLLAVAAFGLFAQSGDAPRFAVATVKRNSRVVKNQAALE